MMWYVIERPQQTTNPLALVFEFESLGGALKKMRELKASGRDSVIAQATTFGQGPVEPNLAWRLNHSDLFPIAQKGHVFLWRYADDHEDERELTAEETANLGVFEGYVDWHPEGKQHGYVAWAFANRPDGSVDGAFYDHVENKWE